MDDELRALFVATELRAHLVTMSRLARTRLMDAIMENLCRSCGGPADHAFCDVGAEFSPPVADEPYYDELLVMREKAPSEDRRDYAGYYCYVKGQPRTLEEWKNR